MRIKVRPAVSQIDGVDLSGMLPGTLREVSPSIGAWLVAEGYAEPEMRRTPRERTRAAFDSQPFRADRRSRPRFQ